MERSRYSTVAIALHWLIGLAIIGNLIGGLTNDAFPPDQRAIVMGLHKSMGLLILLLSLARIGWRLANPPPPLPAHMTGGERLAARATHIGFYALMLMLPLSGWALASAGKRPLEFFWAFLVPKLPVDAAMRGVFGETHEILGWVMIALLTLHILAVAKHQWFDRDNVLARMLPGRRHPG
jgi:cytochrome b561